MEGTPMDSLSAALHILAGDVCLRVSPDYIARCRAFKTQDQGRIDSTALSTWLCDGGHFFTLFRPSAEVGTLLFSHTNEVLYHASVDAQLSNDCPADLCFLCQFTTDSSPEGAVPRLLAFDVVVSQPPSARGDMLRGSKAICPSRCAACSGSAPGSTSPPSSSLDCPTEYGGWSRWARIRWRRVCWSLLHPHDYRDELHEPVVSIPLHPL